jgi:predicted RND superfamily exporter protein
MHVLSAGSGKSGAGLESALSEVALPVALSGLTTAIGFIGISVVRIDAIRDVGAYGALGVLLVLAGTLTGVPALMRVFPVPYRENRLRLWLAREGPSLLCDLAVRKGSILLVGWTVALVLVGIGIGRVRVETDVIEWFPRTDAVRRSYEEIRTRLSGISPMNVVVEAEPGKKVSSPEVIVAVDRLAAELEALPEVGKVVSIADPLRQIHGGFTGDRKDPLPIEGDLIEQYLLLLEAKPYMRNLMVGDRTATNIIMRVDDNGSDALLRVGREVQERWARFGPPGTEARATGIMYEFGRAEDEIARGQLRGLAIAIGAIGLVLLGIFRDVRLAGLALIPNTVPVVMAFGVMGLLGVPLDAGTVILGSLALGIAVDDTVHVTEAFVLARFRGYSPEEAMVRSFSRVLEPVVFTSLIVAMGFAVLVVSGFSLTRNLGLLTSGVMLLCLATDLLLLPALLVRFRTGPRRGKAA